MKLKTLFLLAAGIGCGLFATILKTSKGDPSAHAGHEPEQQVIFFSGKDLSVGTKLDKEKLAELIRKKKVNKADVPPNAILKEDELIGKTVTQNLKADDCLLVTSVGRVPVCCAASGKHLYVIKLPYESVGPWVQAGKEVDVVCSYRTPGSTVVRHMQLLHKMPVVAVEYWDQPTRAMDCGPLFCSVTLVASLEEAHWLQMAQDAGASLRFLVRTGNANGGCPKLPDDELYEPFKGMAKDKQNRQDNTK